MKERFETFTITIARISRCIRKLKTMEVEEFNLKSPHVSCLYYLYKHNGALTAKELCEACDEDKAAISRSIVFLEKEGYITCETKNEKRYKSPLTLTDKGLKASKHLVDRIDKVVDLASTGLSDNDRANFYKSLLLISENLQNLCDEYDDKETKA